jgi:protein SCO1/2
MFIGLGLTVALMVVGIWLSRLYQQRPSQTSLPIISQVPDVTLTNQQGQPVRMTDLKGRVWVADIIFTRCAGPCPEMTRRMASLQKATRTNAPVTFVTLTTDPDYDVPKVLKAYGERFGADFNRWRFLTGSKADLRKVAVDGLKLVAIEKDPGEQTAPNDLFIHSTIFVVVDQLGQLRASFESTEADFEKRLQAAVDELVRARPN